MSPRKSSSPALRAWLLDHVGQAFTIAEVLKKCDGIAGRTMVGKTLRQMVRDGEVQRVNKGYHLVVWYILDAKRPFNSKAQIAADLRKEAIWPDLETYTMIKDVRSVDPLS